MTLRPDRYRKCCNKYSNTVKKIKKSILAIMIIMIILHLINSHLSFQLPTPYDMAIVRVRHPKGVLKIDLPQNETKILWIYEKIATELAPFYPEIETFWISLDPKEPEKSRLIPTPDSFISFSHGQLIYLHLKSLVKAADIDIINSNYSEASLDEKLRKNDGKIIRKRDERLCRHGHIGMCEHCQPLEVKLSLIIIVVSVICLAVRFKIFGIPRN